MYWHYEGAGMEHRTAPDHMTRDIVAWIETGFEGSPAFVTNLNGFMNDLADAAAGRWG